MSDLSLALACILQSVLRPGDFHATGRIDIFTDRKSVV